MKWKQEWFGKLSCHVEMDCVVLKFPVASSGCSCFAWVLWLRLWAMVDYLSWGHKMLPKDTEVLWNPKLPLSLLLVCYFPWDFSFLFPFSLSLYSELSAFYLKCIIYIYILLFSFLSAVFILSPSALDPWSNLCDYFKCFISWVLAFYLNLFYIKNSNL